MPTPTKLKFILLVVLAIALGGCERGKPGARAAANATAAAGGEEKATVSFNHHVQPILSENCYACHGFDPGSRFPAKEPLRLDRAEFAFQARANGKPVIVKGDPAASDLIARVKSADPDEVMPPPRHHKTLSAEAIDTLERWIAQGAEYEEHWAFIPPTRPAVPQTAGDSPTTTPIDAFIARELRAHQLEPAPPESPRRLLRRVALDLTGLLPDPADVEAFAAAPSEENYRAQVDKLLASPHFGEHRARYWLDYARYADTHGKHFDNSRAIWPWRDYVIRSLNANKPFDRFIREQLAGDQLADADFDSLIGTGYLRCAVTTNEGGTIPEEVLVDKTRDRTEAFGAAFLGLTVGCAACHDHKFDPVTQKDFYSLSAFFNNTTDKPWDDNNPESGPILRIPPPDKAAEANATASRLAALKTELAERGALAASLLASHPPQPVAAENLAIHLKCDEASGDVLHNSAPGATESFQATINPLVWGETTWLWPAMRMEINSKLVLGKAGDFEADQGFTVASWLNLRLKTSNATTGDGSIISRMGDLSHLAHRGWDVFMEGNKFVVHLVHQWPDHVIRVETPPYPRGIWRHLAVSYDGSAKAAGVKVFIDGKEAPLKITKDTLQPGQTIRTDAPLQLGRREDTLPLRETAFQDLRIYQRTLTGEELGRLPFEAPAAELVAAQPDPDRWNPDQRFLVFGHWLHGQADPEAAALRAKIAAEEGRLNELTKGGPATLVAYEHGTPAQADVLDRGVYSARKERVFSATPHFLPGLPPATRPSRAALADWLLAADNPLFARVTVNRIWQELFGTGLVETPDDFGIMGARPSHPELLDWLAVEFRESGWDFKGFYRLLVLSNSYRQSSATTTRKLAADPANRLVSRGPSARLDGEILRDSALQASGLLVDRIGGPPVKGYQPEGLWKSVSMPESNTYIYQQDHGEALYRRSLYSFWKRFAPPPSMETFDAPAREVVCARRPRTNTPLQALVMMNDPQFVEASRKLAERLLKEQPGDDQARLTRLSTLLLCRPPAEPEMGRLSADIAAYRTHFRSHPQAAGDLLTVGESPADASLDAIETATWTMMASQYFNLDEFLTR